MLSREDLEHQYEMLPDIRRVQVYPRNADSVLGSAVLVTAAEKRSPSVSEVNLLNEISTDLEKATFHLWVVTFKTSLRMRPEFVIKEADGTQWAVVGASLEMMETRWRCPCIEYLGRGAN